ncbi:serine hydrolase domain-containing protein [Kitasatospora sp. NPDC054939]
MTRTPLLRAAVPALALAGLLTACSGPAPRPAGQAPASAVPAANNQPTATPTAGASGPVKALTPEVMSEVVTAIQQVQQAANVPCVAYAVFDANNQGGAGTMGVTDRTTGRACTGVLPMRIGSVTKTFTVTGLLRLVDQGKVGLDDTIGKYIPGVPNGDRITLRQLAEMRSGLYSYTFDPDFANALESDPTRQFTPPELLAYSFKHPVVFEPGARFQYSNTNTVLLGLVVEQVGGKPLNTFLQEEVISKAGLTGTLFPVDAAHPASMPHGYTDQTPDGQVVDATDWNPSWAWAAGAMISQRDDLTTWAKVLATGTLLTPKTQAERLAMLPTGIGTTRYGLAIFDNNGWIGHNGSLPGYESLVLYQPASRTTLVVQLTTDITYQGEEPSTVFGKAITQIISPNNVYDLPPEPSTSPTASASPTPPGSPTTPVPPTTPTPPPTPGQS